jgi:hypothetical protein
MVQHNEAATEIEKRTCRMVIEEKENYKAQSSCIFVQLQYQYLTVQKFQIMLDLHLDFIRTTVE